MRRGFCKVKESLQLSARLREERKRKTAARTVLLRDLNNIRNSSVDVAPTLGVNHVYLVLWFLCIFSFLFCYLFRLDKYMNEC